MIGASMAARAPRTRGLGQMAMDAIRRNGGTLLLPGLPRNWLDSVGTIAATVDNPVGLVQDSVGSNHATQPTTASKPILRRGLVNQLRRSGEFVTNDQWTVAGLSSTTVTGPDGSSSATMLTVTNASSALAVSQITPVVATSTEATVAYVLKATGDANTRPLLLRNGTTATIFQVGVFNQVTGAITGAGWTSTAMGSDWYLVTFTQSSGISVGNILLLYAGFAGGPQVMSSTLVIHRAALFQGPVTASQILAAGGIPLTTTAPASSERGNYAWQWDGSNDFLQTGITTGNEGWVCAGVTFQGAASGLESVFCAGGGGWSEKGVWAARVGSLSENSWRVQVPNGSAAQQAVVSTVPLIGARRVVEGGWSASSIVAGVDGVIEVAARSGDATSAYPAVIGAYLTGSFLLNGSMSATVYTPVLPSAADRALIRRFVGSLQGQQL